MNDRGSSGSVVAWLRERSALLLLSHERPDGDAYGALYGLLLGLEAAGRRCALYLREPLPAAYQRLFPQARNVVVGDRCPDSDFEGVVCLDVTDRARVDCPAGVKLDALAEGTCVIDHHPDNHWQCAARWVAPDRASTAQMVAAVLRQAEWAISPSTATCLLTGLVMDTGGLRFDNTDAEALLEAARLMDEGAEYARVMREMFLRKPYGRALLEARLLRDARFACDGRIAYAVLDAGLLAEFGLRPNETEGVIDVLKGIDGVDIACLLQPEPGAVRLSMRSTNPRCPVNDMARQLGGGGHPLAAGATAEGVSTAEAERMFLQLATRTLGADSTHR